MAERIRLALACSCDPEGSLITLEGPSDDVWTAALGWATRSRHAGRGHLHVLRWAEA